MVSTAVAIIFSQPELCDDRRLAIQPLPLYPGAPAWGIRRHFKHLRFALLHSLCDILFR